MARHLSLLVFVGFLSLNLVESSPGFFYSTGYFPFGQYAPYTHSPISYPYAHHAFPAIHHALSYSGCRNVHGALVPCALPTPFIAHVEAPVAVEPVAQPIVEDSAAIAEVASEAAAAERKKREAVAEAEADPYLLYGYGHHAFSPYSYRPYHPAPYLGHGIGLGHHLPNLHSYYAHTGCKNYLGSTVPCL